MLKLLTAAVWLSMFFAGPALAKPAQRSNELRIGQSFMPGLSITGINQFSSSNSTDPAAGSDALTLLSLGAGYGRFLTDNIELGGYLSFTSLSSGNTSVSGPGLSPFLRFFGSSGKIGYFAEAVFAFQSLGSDSDTVTIYGGGADAGLEFFLADSWALRVAPGFRHLRAKASATNQPSQPSEGLTSFGLNWAIAAYF